MGLYIPDLKLPADGDFELWIAVKKDGSFTYNVRGGWQDGKQKAIPVPPHGRLIDADEYKKLLPSIENEYKYARKLLDSMPTIIPPEEE